MTQVTLHAIDGSGDLLVEADEESVEVLEKSPGSNGDLFRARMSVTVAGGSAQTIDCMIDESTGTVSAGPDVLAALRGHPLDDPAARRKSPLPRRPPSTSPSSPPRTTGSRPKRRPAPHRPRPPRRRSSRPIVRRSRREPGGNPGREPPGGGHRCAGRATAGRGNSTDGGSTAGGQRHCCGRRGLAVDGERELEEFRVQYENWILGMAPLVMYNAADTTKTIGEMSWSGAAGRQALDANSWTVDVSLTAQGTPSPAARTG